MSSSYSATVYRFGDFVLDVANRQLLQNEHEVDLNARYFDALVLLVGNAGQLIPKDRFFSDVWDNLVVSDAALTQCIKDLRKLLGDNASQPRYIQTVPRHGYRFIAQVYQEANAISPEIVQKTTISAPSETVLTNSSHDAPISSRIWQVATEGVSAVLGGALAGIIGGSLYGFALAFGPDAGIGALSKLLVLICLCVLIGAMGGLGVGYGMAIARAFTKKSVWAVAGAALGGMFVGGMTKLLGVDAFSLLFGVRPAGITGGVEGAILGAATACSIVFGGGVDARSRQRPITLATISGATAGLLIAVIGGRLMAGSLYLLTQAVPSSQLQMDGLGRFFGEDGFGHLTLTLLSTFEGMLFSTSLVWVMMTYREKGDEKQVNGD